MRVPRDVEAVSTAELVLVLTAFCEFMTATPSEVEALKT